MHFLTARTDTFWLYFDNPINFLGDYGDYFNEKGEKIGNEGKDDGKLYVIRTTKTNSDLNGVTRPKGVGEQT